MGNFTNNLSIFIDVFKYLAPNDFFQAFFLLIILSLSFWAVWGVKKKANAFNWNNNWKNNTENAQNDDMDSEQGSVLEISQAIATAPEKFAEILPGILLILGLLGTFLGLGLSLDEASKIISQAKLSGMDTAMEKLVSMLNKLGVNFITSVWGILANLIFRYWISKNGFEENRLKWTIKKTKEEMNTRRDQLTIIEEIRHQDTIKCLNQINKSLVEVTENQKNHLIEQLNKVCDFSNTNINKIIELNSNMTNLFRESINQNNSNKNSIINEINNSQVSMNNTISKSSEKLSKEIVKETKNVSENTYSLKESIENFITANENTLNEMQETGSKMSEASVSMGKSASKLDTAIVNFESKVTEVLTKMSDDFNENLEVVANDLGEATNSIACSVDKMDKQVNNTLSGIKESLNSAIQTQETSMNKTIKEMNSNFKTNLEKMAKDLSSATNSISNAVNTMNNEITKTLGNVGNAISDSVNNQKDNLEKAVKIQEEIAKESRKQQEDTQIRFASITSELSEQIVTTTRVFENMYSEIRNGLKAVSDKRQEMVHASGAVQEAVKGIQEALKLLENNNHQPILANINQSLQEYLQMKKNHQSNNHANQQY
ncbi:MAG TPA: hypothetical protein PKJ08_07940 [Candidatus Cloacimonadota bacterium]|nr:hypothetical protein [Candidatus Cloacimonadota bacterium]